MNLYLLEVDTCIDIYLIHVHCTGIDVDVIFIPVASFRRGRAILGGANVDGGPSWLYLDNHCLVFILVKNNSIVIAAAPVLVLFPQSYQHTCAARLGK